MERTLKKMHHSQQGRGRYSMCRVIISSLIGILLSALFPKYAMAEDINIHELLAKSTFYFYGPTGIPGEAKAGTVFLVSRPIPKIENGIAIMMVTANHVLDEVKSDTATVVLREKDQNGSWKEKPVSINVRKGGVPLWHRHISADIGVLPLLENLGASDLAAVKALLVKKEIEYLPYSGLSEDNYLEKSGISIGSELSCLGFPYNVGSPGAGQFPMLRGGKLASYPLYPSREIKSFYFDFSVFPGNSGGPVYFREKYTKIGGEPGVILREGTDQGLAGLVTEKRFAGPQKGLEDIALATVVPSSLVKDTVDATPSISSP